MDKNMFLYTNPDHLEMMKKIQENHPDLVRQQKMLDQKKYRHERLHQSLYGILAVLGLLLAVAEVVVFSMDLLPVENLISVGSLGISFMCFSRLIIEKMNRAFWERAVNQDLQLYMKLERILEEEKTYKAVISASLSGKY